MATSMNYMPENLSCEDFGQFEDTLKQMRLLDDRIIQTLNTTIPTNSFSNKINASQQCRSLFDMITVAHKQREAAIKKCIDRVWADVSTLKKQKEAEPDNFDLLLQLRKEQTKLKLMRSELNVEEIIQDRTLKVFHERCRNYFNPKTDHS